MQKYKRISSTVDLSDTIIRKIFEMTTKKAIRQTQKKFKNKKKMKNLFGVKKKTQTKHCLAVTKFGVTVSIGIEGRYLDRKCEVLPESVSASRSAAFRSMATLTAFYFFLF